MKRILAIILLTLTICSCEASKILKTNTAVVLAVGPFVDFSDGVTPETAMTVTNITMELYKETDEGSAPTRAIGVNPTASGGNNDMVHITSDVAGFYSIELTASNLNFLGRATLVFTDPDVCLPVFVPITVVSDQIYSSLIEDDDELQVHANEITSGLITATAIASDAIGADEIAASAIGSSEIGTGAIDADAIAADAIGASEMGADSIGASEIGLDAITSSEVAASAVTEIQTGLSTFNHASNQVTVATNNDKTGYSVSTLGAGTITASVIATDAITNDEIGSTAVTELQAGLAAETSVDANETKIDTLTTNVGTVDTVVDAIKAKTDSLTFTTANKVDSRVDYVGTNAVTSPNDFKADVSGALATYDGPTKAEMDAAFAALNDLSPAQLASASDEIAALINALNDITASDVWSNGTRTLTDPLAAEFDIVSASINGLEGSSAPSAATIADAVWDEAISGHASAGSTGGALSGASAPSAATVADAVWDEATSGHQTAGTTGLALTNASSPTATQIRDAILAASINQTTLEEALEWIYTWAVGSFVKSGSAVTYKDSLGTTVFSFNIGSSSRTHGE